MDDDDAAPDEVRRRPAGRRARRIRASSRGRGRYTDDVDLPGQAYARRAALARAPWRRSAGIDTGAARAAPGVLAVLYRRRPQRRTAQLCASCRSRATTAAPCSRRRGRCSRRDRVRYVGEPLALVVAESVAAARGRGRADRARHRAAAGAGRSRARRSRPARRTCTTTARTSASTGALATSPRPRRAFAARRARHPPQARQQPRGRGRDGAARRDRRVRRGERPLHAPRRLPGRVRPAPLAGRGPAEDRSRSSSGC